jgi:hypothetical protein
MSPAERLPSQRTPEQSAEMLPNDFLPSADGESGEHDQTRRTVDIFDTDSLTMADRYSWSTEQCQKHVSLCEWRTGSFENREAG